MQQTLLYQIALTLIPGIGPVKARILINHCGSAEAVFREKKTALMRIPDIGIVTAELLKAKDYLKRAEHEILFMEENQIIPLFYQDHQFPHRLKECEDSPILIYTKGRMDLNSSKMISIVGTRKATGYGKSFCQSLLRGIDNYKPVVVSGLAFGIDICAHKNALELGLPTIACVAHGLEKIYPQAHSGVVSQMFNNGGLISEFISETKMAPELFPMRNRLIAGLSDCTIVIETDERGGSMITAHIANSYGREVFALPGRYYDKHSAGCNLIIRSNLGAIITSPEDLIRYMNWDKELEPRTKQLPLFDDFTDDETSIMQILKERGKTDIDMLCRDTGISFSKLATLLLELEFRGVICSNPGKNFELTTAFR